MLAKRSVLQLLLAAALLVGAWPAQAGTASAPAAPEGQPMGSDLLDRLMGLGAADPDAFELQAHGFLAERGAGPGLARYAVVPESIYKGAKPTCDLDGDGTADLVSNEMMLRRNGNFDSGFSTLRAISGANGTELWHQDNDLYYNLALENAYSVFRPGQPSPVEPPNMVPIVDVNGDGVCDVLAYGFVSNTLVSTPVFGNPSVSLFDVTVRALSGSDGTPLWTRVISAQDVDVTDPLYPVEQGRVIKNFPTGFFFTQTPDGPRLVLKTTDLVYTWATDPFEVTNPVVDGDTFWMANLYTAEHLVFVNVMDGSTLWSRDFPDAVTPAVPTPVPGVTEVSPVSPLNPKADSVNVTWISGIRDVTGDGHPDIVLDQFTLSNPRGAQFVDPTTGQPFYRHGRGMRMFALDGADGADLWSTTLLDPLVTTAPVNEENTEVLAWTHGSIAGDLNGDGVADPMAQYLAEEFVGATPNGRFRTHFIPLDGLTGMPLWQYTQQGWGFGTLHGPGRIAIASLDLPAGNPTGGRGPEKALRIAALDAATGAPQWSYESAFAQDSQSIYEIGLHQVRTSLAPVDLDGDGVREVVTPSRYVAPEGQHQVFLATAVQDFQILDGQTGKLERTLDSWGSNGLLLPCSTGTELTFVVGHARRLDLVRVDAITGETLLRRAVWNYIDHRASLVGIDLMGLAGTCAIDAGRLTYGINMEAFSYHRRYEIVPLMGVVQLDGAPVWRQAGTAGFLEAQGDDGEPPTPSLLETLATPPALVPAGLPLVALTVAAAAVGLVLGGLVGIPAGRALARRRARWDPLRLAMAILVIPGAAFGGLAGEGTDDVAATTPMIEPAVTLPPGLGAASGADAAAASSPPAPASATGAGERVDWRQLGLPTAAEEVAAWSRLQAGLEPDVSDRFGENDTLVFPHMLGDEDGDGVQDMALDVYCTNGASCYDYYPGLTDPAAYVERSLQPEKCGPDHQLVVISGARGDRMWDESLAKPVALRVAGGTTSCGAEAVVGVVPLPEGKTGILLYRFEVTDVELGMTGKVYNHTIFLRDSATGSILWRFNQPGYLTPTYLQTGPATAVVGANVFLNPMLVKPDTDTLVDRTAGAGVGLFVQSVGYRLGNINTVGAPGLMHGPRGEDSYEPIQWLASLDPVTGAVDWRVDSFQPSGRSILPFAARDSVFRDAYFAAEDHGAYDYPYWIPAALAVNQWGGVLCCGDLTGDGIADPAFTTLEWTNVVNANTQIHRFDTRLVIFDGATGQRLCDEPILTDVKGELNAGNRRPFWRYPYDAVRTSLTGVGDADGDGDGDILVRSEVVASDYVMDLRIMQGDGATVWQQESPRAQAMLVLGDADGDGGNDLLFVDWYKLERLAQVVGDETNVTATPLKLRSGATGDLIYQTSTVNAPRDIVQIFATLQRNGVPDLDRDGVGDFPVDDPIYLPDQITLHQVRFLSGRDGSKLFDIPVAGAFAFPSSMPDLNFDGRPELAILSGDPNDLWMSYRDGKDGSALWGHRAYAIKTSSFTLINPKMQMLPFQSGFGEHDRGFVLNLHLDIERVTGEYEAIYIDAGGSTAVRQLYFDTITVPQLTAVHALGGRESWSYPSQGSIDLSRLDGESPGTALVLQMRTVAEPTMMDSARRIAGDTVLPIAAFAAAFAAALLAVSLLLRRRGVPA